MKKIQAVLDELIGKTAKIPGQENQLKIYSIIKFMKLTTSIFIILFFCLLFVTDSNSQTVNQKNSSVKQTMEDKPLTIKSKPQLQYTQQTCDGASGVVKLRITFDKSEKVTDVEIVASSGCKNFDEMAVKAAKKIKFKPAMRNGKPVSTRSLVEYTFAIY